jgi:DNA adenine methylase
MNSVKPPLKWAGSKRWLTPFISFIWYSLEKPYVYAPFAGSLAPEHLIGVPNVVFSDNIEALHYFQQWVRLGGLFDLSYGVYHDNTLEAFNRAKKAYNCLIQTGSKQTPIDKLHTGKLLYTLNRRAFNGLIRHNRKGEFNVPFGKYKQVQYITNWEPYRQLYAGWRWAGNDYIHTLRWAVGTNTLNQNKLIVADPPYYGGFVGYSGRGFNAGDQKILAKMLGAIATRGVPIIATNSAHQDMLDLYQANGFQVTRLDAPRSIAAAANKRVKQVEAIFTRNISLELLQAALEAQNGRR